MEHNTQFTGRDRRGSNASKSLAGSVVALEMRGMRGVSVTGNGEEYARHTLNDECANDSDCPGPHRIRCAAALASEALRRAVTKRMLQAGAFAATWTNDDPNCAAER